MSNAVIAQYIEAFNSAYPQKNVEVKFAKKIQGEEHYHVIVDSERGGDTLTTNDMRHAIRGFMAGK